MVMKKDYVVTITGIRSRVERWSWYGAKAEGLKILHNDRDYTADTFLLMNNDDRIVGGYEFVFNSSNALSVKPFRKATENNKDRV